MNRNTGRRKAPSNRKNIHVVPGIVLVVDRPKFIPWVMKFFLPTNADVLTNSVQVLMGKLPEGTSPEDIARHNTLRQQYVEGLRQFLVQDAATKNRIAEIMADMFEQHAGELMNCAFSMSIRGLENAPKFLKVVDRTAELMTAALQAVPSPSLRPKARALGRAYPAALKGVHSQREWSGREKQLHKGFDEIANDVQPEFSKARRPSSVTLYRYVKSLASEKSGLDREKLFWDLAGCRTASGFAKQVLAYRYGITRQAIEKALSRR